MVSYTDTLHILLRYASRGMGNQCDVITRYILKSFYPAQLNGSYRATVSRFLAGQSGLPHALSKAIKTSNALMRLSDDLSRYLTLLPGISARYLINSEIFKLVQGASINPEAKSTLLTYYHPESVSIDEITNFVAHVLMYCFENVSPSSAKTA